MNAAEDNNTVRSRAEHIDVDTSPERVSRLWIRVADELDTKAEKSLRPQPLWQAPRAYAFASALLIIALVGAGLWSQRPAADSTTSTAGLQQATLETASDSMAVDLQDGSRVELSAHTRVTVEEQTPGTLRLRLEHGSIVCDVAPDPSRQFLVHAAGATVRVTGTRFRVEVTRAESKSGKLEQHVRVNVTRGSVEVQGADTKTPPQMLTAGDSLALKPESDVHPKPRTAKQPATPTVEMGDLPNAAFRETAEASLPARNPASHSDTQADATTPRELLEQGRVARREGNPSAAAQAYQELLKRFPSDSRAGLAAFELGRLRMDRLGNLSGAVEALRQAVRLAPGSGFREDAMARLVEAYERLGQQKSCVAARDSYLKAFPRGVHANAARARCQ